ncbi:MAG: thioesterase family protein [Chitinophagaceae bacterium]
MDKKFQQGDHRSFIRLIKKSDTAAFEGSLVHPVYSTFALARDAEWCCRKFVLEMKSSQEEGIGTYLEVEHLSPALIKTEVKFIAYLENIEDNEIICRFEALQGTRLIARGKHRQKILPVQKIKQILETLKNNPNN